MPMVDHCIIAFNSLEIKHVQFKFRQDERIVHGTLLHQIML